MCAFLLLHVIFNIHVLFLYYYFYCTEIRPLKVTVGCDRNANINLRDWSARRTDSRRRLIHTVKHLIVTVIHALDGNCQREQEIGKAPPPMTPADKHDIYHKRISLTKHNIHSVGPQPENEGENGRITYSKLGYRPPPSTSL